MKKFFAVNLLLVVALFIIVGARNIYATSDDLNVYTPYFNQTPLPDQNNNTVIEQENPSTVSEIKSTTSQELSDYEQKYGSKAYGYTAYALSKLRIFSIPLCFLGIAIGSIYQYVIGIRRLDIHDRGFTLIVGFVTVLVICQVLPLIFAIIVQGWRG
ncbi:MAG: hypothetical protein FWF46_01340 [Oscillospiraceae bacterium]|nr:hypothetical protein [Oscillospiraceae bacterium]